MWKKFGTDAFLCAIFIFGGQISQVHKSQENIIITLLLCVTILIFSCVCATCEIWSLKMKMVQTKASLQNSQRKKEIKKETNTYKNMFLFGSLWSRMVLYGPVGSRMVPNSAIWSRMVPYGHVWSSMVPYGPVWSRMVPYGPVWSRMAPDGPLGSPTVLQGPVLSRMVPYCPI